MTEKLLINLDDLKKFRPLGEDIKQDRVDPFIREAQRQDLRPLLGDALYWDFIQNFDVSSYNVGTGQNYANYQTLLNGEPYTYGGAQVVYDGLVAMMSYFTLAKFIPNAPINVTKYGITQKKNEYSDPTDPKEIARIVNELRSTAILYGNQLTQYLYMNQAKFTLYPQLQTENMNKQGLKFFDPNKGSEPASSSRMYPYNLR